MRSNEILTAVLCTIAHLESVQAAPVSDLSPVADKREPVNWAELGEDALKGLATSVSSTVGTHVGTGIMDEVESLASNFARAPEKREPKKSSGSSSSSSSSTGTKTGSGSGIGGALVNGLGGLAGGYLVDGVEDAWNAIESMVPRAPNEMRDAAGLVETREPKKSSGSSSSSSSSSSSGTKTGSGSGIGGALVNGLGGLAGGYLVDGVEDAWNAIESMVPRAPNEMRDAAGLVEKREPKKSSGSSSSSGTKTSGSGSGIGGALVNGLGGLAGGYLVDGVEEAWNAIESMVPRAPNEIRDAAGLTEEQRRSLWGTLGKDAAKGLGTGALKTVAEDAWESVESMIPRAPEKRDAAGLTEEERRSLWGTLGKDAAKGLGTGALKTVAEDAWEAVESMIPRAPGDVRDASGKLSTRTDDAPMAARSGIVDTIEDVGEDALPYIEKVLPYAADLLDILKREAGSNTNSAPMAARSGIVDTIEDVGEEALPYIQQALPYAADLLDILKRDAASRTSDAPLAARSGVWDEVMEGLGIAGKIGLGFLEEE